jgi:ubiquinone/menaquinone biosynthesis C-methylase UbiE
MAENSETVAGYITSRPGASWISPQGLENSLERLVGIGEGKRIADLGAGNGELAKRIAERRSEAEVVATEFSQKAAESAYKNTQDYENVSVVRTDKLRGLDDNYFDQIYAINSLQALETPERGLREISRALEPGGTAVITVPGEESAEIFPEEWLNEEENSTYIEGEAVLPSNRTTYSQYVFPRQEMRENLKDSGFRVREDYPQEILSDPTGLPHLASIMPEDADMSTPSSLETAMKYIPDTVIQKIVETSGKGPEVDLWVSDKV